MMSFIVEEFFETRQQSVKKIGHDEVQIKVSELLLSDYSYQEG